MKTATRYPLSISLLHWLLAVALIGNLIVGLLLDDNEDLVGLHKSIGVAILLLVALRLVNRLRARDRLPPSVNPAGTLRHSAERAIHGLLYALMLAIPVLGWLKTNAAGHPASCFGLFSLPTLSRRTASYRTGSASCTHSPPTRSSRWSACTSPRPWRTACSMRKTSCRASCRGRPVPADAGCRRRISADAGIAVRGAGPLREAAGNRRRASPARLGSHAADRTRSADPHAPRDR